MPISALQCRAMPYLRRILPGRRAFCRFADTSVSDQVCPAWMLVLRMAAAAVIFILKVSTRLHDMPDSFFCKTGAYQLTFQPDCEADADKLVFRPEKALRAALTENPASLHAVMNLESQPDP